MLERSEPHLALNCRNSCAAFATTAFVFFMFFYVLGRTTSRNCRNSCAAFSTTAFVFYMFFYVLEPCETHLAPAETVVPPFVANLKRRTFYKGFGAKDLLQTGDYTKDF
ncbi:MAG: hypothetical protein R6V53_02785 [Candidatus Woesearchaeota archaeon]